MSAPELHASLDAIMNELGTVRYYINNARQTVIDNRVALSKLDSNNEEAAGLRAMLDNLDAQLNDDAMVLLHIHESLTRWRYQV